MRFRAINIFSITILMAFLFGSVDVLFAKNKIVLIAGKPITSQISATDKGTVYIIAEDIDLKGSTVDLPEETILQFEGGRFSNGGLKGNNSTIIAGRYEIFNAISLSGKWTIDGLPVEWFGAKPNNSNYDCSSAINLAISTGVVVGVPTLLGSGTYYINKTLDIPADGALVGLSPSYTTIRYYADAVVGVYLHGQNITFCNVCVREHGAERKGICIKIGDIQDKESCTRGYFEDIKAIGGRRGLDLEYQWCNKINGVNCRYNDIGIYANSTTPYIENAVVEGNYQCGVYSEGAGVKLYNAVIEGNKVGCILNGKENLLNNCYFEGNTAASRDEKTLKDDYGFDVEGGHIFAGEQSVIINLIMIGCHISNTYKKNNTIKIDKCLNFTAIGCNSLDYLELTENCNVKYLDRTYTSLDEYGEYSLASRIPRSVSDENFCIFQCSDFREAQITDTNIALDDNGYYSVNCDKSRFVLDETGMLSCFRKVKVKPRVIQVRVSDPVVLNNEGDIVLSTMVQYPKDMRAITPSQGISITGVTKDGKQITVKVGKNYTPINKKIRAGQATSYDVRVKRSYIENLMIQNDIIKLEYITMNNSLVYDSTDLSDDLVAGNEFKLVGLSVGLAPGR